MTDQHPDRLEGSAATGAQSSTTAASRGSSATEGSASAASGRERTGHDSRRRVERTRILGTAAAEVAGTTILVLVGLAAGVLTAKSGTMFPGLGFGLGLFLAVVAFGHVSGGHFNPAVTMGVWLSGRLQAKDAVVYLLAQVVGAIIGAGLLYLFFASYGGGSGATQALSSVSNGFGDAQGATAPLGTVLLVETVMSALFVAVVLGATQHKAAPYLAPLAIGTALAVFLLIAAPFDGGSLNPARSLASALFSGDGYLGKVWVFWLAPLVGGAVAGVVYRAVDQTVTAQDGLREAFEEPEALEQKVR